MALESAAKGGAEIVGEQINKMGIYSRKNIGPISSNPAPSKWKPRVCYNCGNTVNGSIIKHLKELCPARNIECSKCFNTGHFAK